MLSDNYWSIKLDVTMLLLPILTNHSRETFRGCLTILKDELTLVTDHTNKCVFVFLYFLFRLQ